MIGKELKQQWEEEAKTIKAVLEAGEIEVYSKHSLRPMGKLKIQKVKEATTGNFGRGLIKRRPHAKFHFTAFNILKDLWK